MTSKQVDWLNTGLILSSLFLAILLPFELFVISYVFIGPLHYFTEIGWLGERQFFLRSKGDHWWLVVLSVIISLGFISKHLDWQTSWPQWLVDMTSPTRVLLATLVSVIVMVIIKSRPLRLILLPAIYIGALLLPTIPRHVLWLLVFLPNLIHVYLFTSVFMLQGAIKSRSMPGVLNVGLLILAAVIIAEGSVLFGHFPTSGWGVNFLEQSGFSNIHQAVAGIGVFSDKEAMFKSVQVFLAFAYTYHYANWFSKTGVIRWHKVGTLRLWSAIFLWVGSIVLYFVDITSGIMFLFFFSVLHVLLELPLNIYSFAFLGKWAIGKSD
jgi:hypothetical protein